MSIDVGTPGFATDITCAEFQFDGQTLSAAVSEMEWNSKTDEERVWFQGLQDPQERTAGQRDYDGTMTWGARQYSLFCDLQGGWDVVKNKEYTLVVHCEPENDVNLYTHTFRKLRLHSDSDNLNKSAGMTKISFSYLSYEREVTAL